MFCSNCGENVGNAKFCPKCGTPVEAGFGTGGNVAGIGTAGAGGAYGAASEMPEILNVVQKSPNKKKKKIIWIGIAMTLLVLALVVVGFIAIGSAPGRKLKKQLDLGNKYLDEMDYERAIVAFNAVLEIDPNNEEACKGLSNIYLVYAEDAEERSDYADAEKYYKLVLQYDPDNSEAKERLEIVRERKKLKKYEEALRTMVKNIIEDPAKYDFSDALILSQDYVDAVAQLKNPIFYEEDDNLYIGVYPNGYIYYGEMKNGERSGHGFWYNGTIESINMVECTWKNDLPNGDATIEWVRNDDKIAKEPGHTYGLYTVTHVNVTDGVYEGDGTIVWDMDDGGQHKWSVTYENGILQADRDGIAAICIYCGATLRASDKVYIIPGLDLGYGEKQNGNSNQETPRDETSRDSENNRTGGLTEEQAYEGVYNYCDQNYGWSLAEEYYMYLEAGEHTEKEYMFIFRSYTGAFRYFYVDKTRGDTRMVDYIPTLDITEDEGTINIYDYLD